MIRLLPVAMLMVFLGASPVAAQEASAPILFHDVTILTMQSDTALPAHAVLVEGEAITWVGPSAEVPVLPEAVVIDSKGGYLLPGLADMHVHMASEDAALFLANGITTVREMNGSPTHLALRDSIAAGLVLGPRMIVSSPLLAGEEQRWRHVLVGDAADAREVAREAVARGYDALKVYDGLSAEAYAALAGEGRGLGVPLVGHIPKDVGLEGVLAAGQRSLEHVEQITYATVGHAPDPAIAQGIAARIGRSESWVVPTLAAQRILADARTRAYNVRFDRAETGYVDEGLLAWWASLKAPEEAADPPPDDPRRRRAEAFYAFQRDLTRALHEAGVPFLVGTDTPNPLLVPGFSIHLEMAALAEVGIPSLDVLRMATRDAARFLGQEERWGVVAPGAVADLVLVDLDPRERMEALASPAGVMVRGKWLDRDALTRMLEELRKARRENPI